MTDGHVALQFKPSIKWIKESEWEALPLSKYIQYGWCRYISVSGVYMIINKSSVINNQPQRVLIIKGQ